MAAGEEAGLAKGDAVDSIKLDAHKVFAVQRWQGVYRPVCVCACVCVQVERIYDLLVEQGDVKARETRRRHAGFLSALTSPL